MEGLLIFSTGGVQVIGQDVDTVKFIPILENLLTTLRQQQRDNLRKQLRDLPIEDLKSELESRAC